MKYRKKPIVIEAEQWLGTKESWDRIMAFGDLPWKPGQMGSESFFIATLEGDHRVSKGDWIIRGVQGEYYPIKSDIFVATYELADVPPDLTRTRTALEELKGEVREALHPLHWELASGQEMPNSTVRFRLSDALDRAERVEKGEG